MVTCLAAVSPLVMTVAAGFGDAAEYVLRMGAAAAWVQNIFRYRNVLDLLMAAGAVRGTEASAVERLGLRGAVVCFRKRYPTHAR